MVTVAFGASDNPFWGQDVTGFPSSLSSDQVGLNLSVATEPYLIQRCFPYEEKSFRHRVGL